jgi:hypothetical protein
MKQVTAAGAVLGGDFAPGSLTTFRRRALSAFIDTEGNEVGMLQPHCGEWHS